MSKIVHVAVGVIYREQQYFITKRNANSHQGGKWEFPGGKVELDETIAEALARELKEEINIEVLACQPLLNVTHDYGDKKVLLEVFLVDNFFGEPSAQEGQLQQWCSLADLTKLDFPEANREIISLLKNH
jgi:8-oxo-dGTP diphosphatase